MFYLFFNIVFPVLLRQIIFLSITFTMPMPIKLKLLIDKEKNKVVFAESVREFVDILLSFLTLPVGTIIRVINKQSFEGCINNIYKSVENLDTKYLNTKACKRMLLEPRSSAEHLCEDLYVKVDYFNPRRFYRCPNFDCFTKKTHAFSSVADVNCLCGETMTATFILEKVINRNREMFLKGEDIYIISDDFHVFPATVSNAATCFQKLGVHDVNKLEKRVEIVSTDMLLSLLKMLLVSKTPLTDVFLKKQHSHINEETKLDKLSQINLENDTEIKDKTTVLKLVRDKDTKRVLYAEADHVMVDNLFSFLTFPIGSIAKLLNKNSLLGCVDNLYNSVHILASNSDCFLSDTCKEMLLFPRLYSHYDFSHQILKIESDGFLSHVNCENSENVISAVQVNEIDPKMENLVTENGGGYAKKSIKFMISNEMIITPLSPISWIDFVTDFKVSVCNLIFQEVAIGEAEVMNLLGACLTSSDALNSVFSSVKKPRIFSSSQSDLFRNNKGVAPERL